MSSLGFKVSRFVPCVMSGATGFVLISVGPGQEKAVHAALLKIPGVVELHGLFREYEVIAKLESGHLDDLGHAIVEKSAPSRTSWGTKTLVSTQKPSAPLG